MHDFTFTVFFGILQTAINNKQKKPSEEPLRVNNVFPVETPMVLVYSGPVFKEAKVVVGRLRFYFNEAIWNTVGSMRGNAKHIPEPVGKKAASPLDCRAACRH